MRSGKKPDGAVENCRPRRLILSMPAAVSMPVTGARRHGGATGGDSLVPRRIGHQASGLHRHSAYGADAERKEAGWGCRDLPTTPAHPQHARGSQHARDRRTSSRRCDRRRQRSTSAHWASGERAASAQRLMYAAATQTRAAGSYCESLIRVRASQLAAIVRIHSALPIRPRV